MEEAKDSRVLVMEEAKDNSRIQYADDVETGPRPGKSNRRTSFGARRNSQDSMSIRSVSRNRSVNPGNILPIQYRTM
jgi:sodium/potassium-transporting ATPase subunit alpha